MWTGARPHGRQTSEQDASNTESSGFFGLGPLESKGQQYHPQEHRLGCQEGTKGEGLQGTEDLLVARSMCAYVCLCGDPGKGTAHLETS